MQGKVHIHEHNEAERLAYIMHLNELAIKDAGCFNLLKVAVDRAKEIAAVKGIRISTPVLPIHQY